MLGPSSLHVNGAKCMKGIGVRDMHITGCHVGGDTHIPSDMHMYICEDTNHSDTGTGYL